MNCSRSRILKKVCFLFVYLLCFAFPFFWKFLTKNLSLQRIEQDLHFCVSVGSDSCDMFYVTMCALFDPAGC